MGVGNKVEKRSPIEAREVEWRRGGYKSEKDLPRVLCLCRYNDINNYRTSIKKTTSEAYYQLETCLTLMLLSFPLQGEIPPHAFCQIPKNLNKGMVSTFFFIYLLLKFRNNLNF